MGFMSTHRFSGSSLKFTARWFSPLNINGNPHIHRLELQRSDRHKCQFGTASKGGRSPNHAVSCTCVFQPQRSFLASSDKLGSWSCESVDTTRKTTFVPCLHALKGLNHWDSLYLWKRGQKRMEGAHQFLLVVFQLSGEKNMFFGKGVSNFKSAPLG